MAFSVKNSKGNTYYLNSKNVTLKGGRKQMIYFFSKDERKSTGMAALPAGYKVSENKRTGLPILKKK